MSRGMSENCNLIGLPKSKTADSAQLRYLSIVMLCGFLEHLAFNSGIDLESLSFLLVGLPCGAILPVELVLMYFPRLPFSQAYPIQVNQCK